MKVVLVGSSGLIGSELLNLFLVDEACQEVLLLVRKKIELKKSDKISQEIIDFKNLNQHKALLTGFDAVFCSIGTTKAKTKGNNDPYRFVDYTIPVNLARLSSEANVKKFLLVSSIGADPLSNNFYLKLKGEVEQSISKFRFESIHFFRPSMLLGHRKEFRLGEMITKKLMQMFSFLIPSNFKPIQSSEVAMSMLYSSLIEQEGEKVYRYKQMKKMAKQYALSKH